MPPQPSDELEYGDLVGLETDTDFVAQVTGTVDDGRALMLAVVDPGRHRQLHPGDRVVKPRALLFLIERAAA